MPRVTLENVTHVVYHANCVDGLFGAHAIRDALFPEQKETVVFLPCQYGQPIPVFPEDAFVILVDFSFLRAEVEALFSKIQGLLILDHHATAVDELSGLGETEHFEKILDLNRCGALIARDWAFSQSGSVKEESSRRNNDRAQVWRWVDAYDRRTPLYLQDPRVLSFHLGFTRGQSISVRTFEDVEEALRGDIDEILKRGEARKGFMNEVIEINLSKLAFKLLYDWTTTKPVLRWVATANVSFFLNETADALAERMPELDFFAGFTVDPVFGQTQFSLRAPGGRFARDLHLGRLAKSIKIDLVEGRPGGGHPGAAAVRFASPRSCLPLDEVDERGPMGKIEKELGKWARSRLSGGKKDEDLSSEAQAFLAAARR